MALPAEVGALVRYKCLALRKLREHGAEECGRAWHCLQIKRERSAERPPAPHFGQEHEQLAQSAAFVVNLQADELAPRNDER